MPESLYKKVTDGQGNEQFVEVTQSSLPAAVIGAAGSWVADRSSETSTKLGAFGGGIASPAIADFIGKAVVAGSSGDYMSCAMYGAPALLSILCSLGAIVIPEKNKGPTDEEIHAAVARMPRNQLISLLQPPVSTVQSAGAEVHG